MMVESITVFLEKAVARSMRDEMDALGLRGKVSEAEFAGSALTAQIALIRAHRLTEEARNKLIVEPGGVVLS